MTVARAYPTRFCNLDEAAWRSIVELAQAQLALVTGTQLREAGWPRPRVVRAVAAGLLVVVRRNVFAVAGAPSSPGQPLLAACLAAGPAAVASHRSAAWLHDVPDALPGPLDVLLPGEVPPRLEGVSGHHSAVFERGDIGRVGGIPATSPARTVVDLASVYSGYRLARALDHVLRTHRCRLPEVRAAFDRVAGRGRSGTATLRRLLEEREEGLGPGDSDLEVRVARALVRAGLPRPVQGHQVVVGRRVFVLDLAWPRPRLAIEVDGFAPHATRTAFDHDRERSMLLVGAGWRILHVTSASDLAAVAATARSHLSK